MRRQTGGWRWLSTTTKPQKGYIRKDAKHWPAVIKKIPMRDSFPQFEISHLLLDLDAEDNSLVRKYDVEVDGNLRTAREIRTAGFGPLKSRIADFEEEYKKDEENFSHVSRAKFSPWRINDLDILKAALRGPDAVSDMKEASRQHSHRPKTMDNLSEDEIRHGLMTWNGISRRASGSNTKLVSNMLARHRRDSRDPPLPSEKLGLTNAMRNFKSLADLKKLVAALMHSSTGRQLASDASDEIAEACIKNIQQNKQSAPIEVMSLMNDIFVALVSNGLTIGAGFARHGFLLAMSLDALPAARQYLNQGFAQPPSRGATGTDEELERHKLMLSDLAGSLWGLMGSVAVQSQVAATTGSSAGSDTGQLLPLLFKPSPNSLQVATYSLLTGQDLISTDHGSNSSVRNTLPHGGLSGGNDINPHKRPYLLLLAGLGAIRTLWHELHMTKFGEAPLGLTQEADVSYDLLLALKVAVWNVQLGHIQSSPNAPSITVATGSYVDDCRLDLQSIALAKYLPDPATAAALDSIAQVLSAGSEGETRIQKLAAASDAAVKHCTQALEETGLTQAMGASIIHAFSIPDIENSMTHIQKLVEEGSPNTEYLAAQEQ
jgi:hypothetical protein